MTIDLFIFLVLALVAVGSALGMLLSQSAVYAALFLVLNFGAVSAFYVLLNAPFIALAQVSVYAGAIMVLFVFVIMLLGTESLPTSKALWWQAPLAVGLALVLVIEAGVLLFVRKATTGSIPQPVQTFGSPQAVGLALFNQYLLPFEITSILLLVAMLGAIFLTKREKGAR